MGLVIDDEEAEAAEKAAKEALDADAPWNEPDEDPPPPAPEGEDAEPELDADGNPVDTPAPVDYKGIAKRLAMATLPVEGEEEVDHLKLVCDACDDIRSLNIVAEDAHGETASKIVYFRVVELLFRHLRAVPAPLPPTPEPELDDEGNPVTPPAEDDKENERTLTVEEQKAADAQAEVRAKWEKVGLPCARALAHLVSVPGAIRREVTDSPYFTQALFALIDPTPFTPKHALALSDVALRCMAQLARGNAAFTSAINACACGENRALAPNAGSWLTRLCAMAPPPKMEETLAEEDAREAEEAAKKEAEGDAYVPPDPPPPHVRWRVASKAMRLATVLARSPKNRARLLRVIEPPRTPITAESLRSEREAAGNGGKQTKIAKNEEQPADILKVAMDCAVKPATRKEPGDKTTRVLALRLVRLACADASEALCRVVDRDDLDGITKLTSIVWSAETDPDVRTEAATAMLAALSKDKRAAEDFGDRNALAALTSLMPAVSDEAPELVIPPPEGGEPAAETPPGETPEETNGDGDVDTDDDISVTGENLLTEAFGLRPIGYITPPPRPKPFRGTQDPLPLATEPTDHPPLYQILLKLLACVITCHDESRRSITDKCAYVLTYKAKMGKPPPKPDDYDTLVRWCVTALREAVEDADPATEPPRPKTEEELAAEAAAAAAAEAEAAAAAEPEPEPEGEGEEGAGGDDPAMEEVESEDEWATESVETIIPPEPDLETEEEKAARLDLGYRTWHAIHDRHIADYRWHNPDAFAGVIGVFNALSGEEAVCKSILSEEFYPGALERIIEVMPKSFATIEEGATFVTRVCEKGAYSDGTMDVEESMRRRVDLVQKLKAIAGCLAAPETARLYRGRVATLAHEAALVMLPLREYLPAAGVRPVPLAEEYHTVPSVPDAPMHTWRRKMTRNVDKADVDTDAARCRVLPLHTVLPELWLDVDPKTGEPWASAGRKFARAIGSLTHPATVQPPPEDGAEPGDLPAPSAEAFDAAVKAVSDEEATKATGPSQHDPPPKCFFSALHFITTVMGAGDAFVQPPPPEPPEEVEGEEPPPPPEPQPPLHEFHLAMWRDPESAPRRFIAAEGEESLSAKMKAWLDANVMYVDKEVMGGADPEAPEVIKQDKVLVANAKAVLAAKELALPGAYVKDAEVESEAAHLMLRWCYSVARFCELAAERRACRIERRTDRLREKREKEKEAARLAAEAEAAAA